MQSSPGRYFVQVVLMVVSALCLVLPSLLAARDVSSLNGVVTDASGALIPDVMVKLTDTKTNTSYETKTNAVGVYTFLKVLPGAAYRLTFTKEGFAQQNIDNVYVGVNSAHTQNTQLKIGNATEAIEVNGTGSQVSLDTMDTTVAASLDMLMVHELPQAIRDTPLLCCTTLAAKRTMRPATTILIGTTSPHV